MKFLPGEKKFFYNKIFMLTTDAHYINEKLSTRELFLNEYKHMANYIREIPLNEKTVTDSKIVIEDFFPIAGAFICIEDEGDVFDSDSISRVRILFDSDIPTDMDWIPAMPCPSQGLRNQYLNFSIAIKNLESNPSYKVHIKGLDSLLNKYNKVKLLTIHYFAPLNLHLDDISKNTKAKLTIHKKSHQ